MMNIGTIYNNFRTCVTLTDSELNLAIKEFTILEQRLSDLGERFHFSWLECKKVLDDLKDMQKYRCLNK